MPDGPLPKPPRTPTPAARYALECYTRLFRRTPPLTGLRRRVIAARLDDAITRFSAKDAASYYAQLQAWRKADG